MCMCLRCVKLTFFQARIPMNFAYANKTKEEFLRRSTSWRKRVLRFVPHKRLENKKDLKVKFAAVSLYVRPREPVLQYRTAEKGHDCETLNQLGKPLFSKALILFSLSSGTKTFSLELLVSRPASSILYVIFCSRRSAQPSSPENFHSRIAINALLHRRLANLSMQDVPTELNGSNLAQGKQALAFSGRMDHP